MKRDPFPILDRIAVKSPCHESWEKMRGSDKKRLCDQCALHVTNLSSMTRKEAARAVRKAGNGRLCVRYGVDANGKILFRPERVSPIRRAMFSATSAFFAALVGVLGFAHKVNADTTAPTPVPTPPAFEPHIQGMIAVPASPAPSAAPTPERAAVMGEMVEAPRSDQGHTPRFEMGKMAAPPR